MVGGLAGLTALTTAADGSRTRLDRASGTVANAIEALYAISDALGTVQNVPGLGLTGSTAALIQALEGVRGAEPGIERSTAIMDASAKSLKFSTDVAAFTALVGEGVSSGSSTAATLAGCAAAGSVFGGVSAVMALLVVAHKMEQDSGTISPSSVPDMTSDALGWIREWGRGTHRTKLGRGGKVVEFDVDHLTKMTFQGYRTVGRSWRRWSGHRVPEYLHAHFQVTDTRDRTWECHIHASLEKWEEIAECGGEFERGMEMSMYRL